MAAPSSASAPASAPAPAPAAAALVAAAAAPAAGDGDNWLLGVGDQKARIFKLGGLGDFKPQYKRSNMTPTAEAPAAPAAPAAAAAAGSGPLPTAAPAAAPAAAPISVSSGQLKGIVTQGDQWLGGAALPGFPKPGFKPAYKRPQGVQGKEAAPAKRRPSGSATAVAASASGNLARQVLDEAPATQQLNLDVFGPFTLGVSQSNVLDALPRSMHIGQEDADTVTTATEDSPHSDGMGGLGGSRLSRWLDQRRYLSFGRGGLSNIYDGMTVARREQVWQEEGQGGAESLLAAAGGHGSRHSRSSRRSSNPKTSPPVTPGGWPPTEKEDSADGWRGAAPSGSRGALSQPADSRTRSLPPRLGERGASTGSIARQSNRSGSPVTALSAVNSSQSLPFVLPEGCVPVPDLPELPTLPDAEDGEEGAEVTEADCVLDSMLTGGSMMQQPFATLIVSGVGLLCCLFPSFRRQTCSQILEIPAQPPGETANVLRLVAYTHYSCPKSYGLRVTVQAGDAEVSLGQIRPRGEMLTGSITLETPPDRPLSLQWFITKVSTEHEDLTPAEDALLGHLLRYVTPPQPPVWAVAAGVRAPPPARGSLSAFALQCFFEGTTLYEQVLVKDYGGSWNRFLTAHKCRLRVFCYTQERIDAACLGAFATAHEARVACRDAPQEQVEQEDAEIAAERNRQEAVVRSHLTELLGSGEWVEEGHILRSLCTQPAFTAMLLPMCSSLRNIMRRHSDRFYCQKGTPTTCAVYALTSRVREGIPPRAAAPAAPQQQQAQGQASASGHASRHAHQLQLAPPQPAVPAGGGRSAPRSRRRESAAQHQHGQQQQQQPQQPQQPQHTLPAAHLPGLRAPAAPAGPQQVMPQAHSPQSPQPAQHQLQQQQTLRPAPPAGQAQPVLVALPQAQHAQQVQQPVVAQRWGSGLPAVPVVAHPQQQQQLLQQPQLQQQLLQPQLQQQQPPPALPTVRI
eukprot:TRINITY_DN10312_c0_g1_i1.p1 TRINITY_DN10312_c0_g1~~TRINITY_DN10312_c0_g1_i1.p1  ORF type:complete len:966 (+),score=215.27 TRINITY_DN10312_c0_g1_i1:143-3040(+)